MHYLPTLRAGGTEALVTIIYATVALKDYQSIARVIEPGPGSKRRRCACLAHVAHAELDRVC